MIALNKVIFLENFMEISEKKYDDYAVYSKGTSLFLPKEWCRDTKDKYITFGGDKLSG